MSNTTVHGLKWWRGGARRRYDECPGRGCFWSKGASPLVILLTASVALGDAAAGLKESSELPNAVRAGLARQADALNRLHIEYVAKLRYISRQYKDRERKTRYIEDYDGKRFHQRWLRGAEEKDDSAFDGRYYYSGNIGESVTLTKMDVLDETDPDRSIPSGRFPYLSRAGFHVPRSMEQMKGTPGISSLVLRHLEQGELKEVRKVQEIIEMDVVLPDPSVGSAKKTNLERKRRELEQTNRRIRKNNWNVPLIPVEERILALRKRQEAVPKRLVTFRLDPSRGYGLLGRVERRISGEKILEVETGEWKHFQEEDVWLPRVVMERDFENAFTGTLREEVFSVHTCRLKQVRFEPRDGVHYRLEASPEYRRPGTRIVDRTTPEAKTNKNHQVNFTIARNGDRLEGFLDLAPAQRRSWGPLSWVVIVGAVLLGWYLYRMRRG